MNNYSEIKYVVWVGGCDDYYSLGTKEPKNIIMNGLSKDMMMCIY
jgi:hypothetical protein